MPKSKPITIEESNNYVENGGSGCPRCGDSGMEGEGLHAEGNVITQDIRCTNPDCGKKWTDVFRLVNIYQ